MQKKYDDMINLEHPTSKTHPRMSVLNRAAQFAPFAALTGYEAAINETARLTDERIELDENTREFLDEKLQLLQEQLAEHPELSVTYFLQDERKAGGSYQTVSAAIKKIDTYRGELVLQDKPPIPIADIIDMQSEIFHILEL